MNTPLDFDGIERALQARRAGRRLRRGAWVRLVYLALVLGGMYAIYHFVPPEVWRAIRAVYIEHDVSRLP